MYGRFGNCVGTEELKMLQAFVWWKFRREISTLFRRVIYLFFLRPFEPLINYLYDRCANRLLSFKNKPSAAMSHKVAIYLVYQPKGLSNSTFKTINALKRNGFSVMVVSNAKLSGADLNRLSIEAEVTLERPNYGIDFGGYRDAVLCLWSYQISIDELLILNDSILCHCGDFDDFMSSIEECSEDVISAVGLKGRQKEETILASYFVMFRRVVLVHPAFIKFWQTYRMANSRYTTVRRGERALSDFIKTSGFSSRAMVSEGARLSAAVGALSVNELKLITRYCALTDDTFLSQMKSLCATWEKSDEKDEKSLLSEFVASVVARRSPVASFPYLAHVTLKMPIQKKGSTLLQRLAVCRFADAITDGFVEGLDPVVVSEIWSQKNRYMADPVTFSNYRRLIEAASTAVP